MGQTFSRATIKRQLDRLGKEVEIYRERIRENRSQINYLTQIVHLDMEKEAKLIESMKELRNELLNNIHVEDESTDQGKQDS